MTSSSTWLNSRRANSLARASSPLAMLQLWQSLTCDHSGCRRRASQFLQTWIDTLICRCWMHRIPSTDMRRDIREISREEAEVLYIQGS